jgi:hypothetical protein
MAGTSRYSEKRVSARACLKSRRRSVKRSPRSSRTRVHEERERQPVERDELDEVLQLAG